MQAFIALIKREYLEHRGAFIYGPALLLALGSLAAIYAVFGTDFRGEFSGNLPTVLRFYETAFALGAAGWLVYLVIMLFFYYGDAFSADSRNNSMLFWKSMPQSDLKIFGSKVAASLTVFPTAILLALAITGVIAYLPTVIASNFLGGFAPPTIGETLSAWLNIMVSAIVLFAIALLWYLPFMAWVGLLGTIFKRWAIPLAFLIPAVIGLFERVVMRNILQEGAVWGFITQRFELKFESLDFEGYWLAGQPWNGLELATLMLTGVDWIQLVGGVAVAVVLIYAASEYRRRYILT
jgi:ABC-2 type transport system permease protein